MLTNSHLERLFFIRRASVRKNTVSYGFGTNRFRLEFLFLKNVIFYDCHFMENPRVIVIMHYF